MTASSLPSFRPPSWLSGRLRNLLQSVVLVAGMAGLVFLCASIIWGTSAALWILGGTFVGLLFAPTVSSGAILALYRARRLDRTSFPAGCDLVEALARRAGLARVPALYYVPSSALNAFAVGDRGNVAIVLTDGVIRTLSMREIAGVVAHEIAHIRNRDLWVMNLADLFGRLTALMSLLGILMLIFMLPLILAGFATVPVALPFVLIVAPTAGSLMQLALSRTREYDADIGAVDLTGDPQGMASALAKLDRAEGGYWERFIFPGRRVPDPSLLRTHPPTEERLRRILVHRPASPPLPLLSGPGIPVPAGIRKVTTTPRRHWSGVWY